LIQRASAHHRFERLLGDQADEECHPDVVDRESQRQSELKIALAECIGPRQPNQHAERQQQEMIEDAIHGAHSALNVSGAA
jgi:hypothetical protein